MIQLWKKDGCLNSINLNNTKVLSCDIFDTLLFRTVATPTDLFEEVAEHGIKEGALLSNISPKMFKELRVRAQKLARKEKLEVQGTNEVNLTDIYLQISPKICNRDRMVEIELEVEKRNMYLNKNMYSFLKYCYNKGRKIVLLSDMYLSSRQIKELLISTGVDVGIFNGILVSNEYGVSKENKGLYNKLIEYCNIPNGNEVVHIGDNYISDYLNAKEYGIKAIYYNLNSKDNQKYQLESVRIGLSIGELISLRKNFTQRKNYKDEEENFWYDFGATVLGPIFAIYIEYIISIAKETSIKNIYPIMRDGYILEKLLREYLKRNAINDIYIKPMYVSRKSTFLASISEIDRKSIANSSILKQLTVESFFERYNVIDHPFKEYNKNSLESTKKILIDKYLGLRLYDEIINYLLKDDIKQRVNKEIIKNRELLISYIEQEFNIEEPFITVDVGYNGSIVSGIEKAFNYSGKKLKAIHLMLLEGNRMLNNILEGVDIRALIENEHSKQSFQSSKFFIPLLIEVFMINNMGSALGYKSYQNKGITPIFAKKNIERMNSKQREICQKGIVDFYIEYLDLTTNKPWLKEKLLLKSKEILWIIERFMKYPTAKEAKYLGDLYCENDFYYKEVRTFCDIKDEEEAKRSAVSTFITKDKEKSNVWISGILERVYPYFMSIQLLKEIADMYRRILLNMAEYLILNKYKECVIFGGGKMGTDLVRLLGLCKVKVNYIIDSNEELWGSKIEGIEVISFERSKQLNHRVYVIASYAFMHEIRLYIQKNHNDCKNLVIIDYENTFR